MKLIRGTWQTVTYWKLATAEVVGKAFVAMVLSMAQALNGADWPGFSPTQKFCAIALAIGSAWNVIDAFLNQTMSRLTAGEKSAIAAETTVTTTVAPVVSAAETP